MSFDGYRERISTRAGRARLAKKLGALLHTVLIDPYELFDEREVADLLDMPVADVRAEALSGRLLATRDSGPVRMYFRGLHILNYLAEHGAS